MKVPMPESSRPLPLVAVVMGSRSDQEQAHGAVQVLREFGIPHELRVISAHRTPDQAASFAKKAAHRGLRVIIALAGGAAHLAGALAAQTRLPVIGVPIRTEMMGGLDSLLSTVQMPEGVPVGCTAVGPAGAANAAHLAIRILALGDSALQARLEIKRGMMARAVRAQDLGLLVDPGAEPAPRRGSWK